MNDDIKFKIAFESVKTQNKMRDQFIADCMKMTNIEYLGKEAIETLKSILIVAYNKGAMDALSILATSKLATMEGGEDYDI